MAEDFVQDLSVKNKRFSSEDSSFEADNGSVLPSRIVSLTLMFVNEVKNIRIILF